jgi:hypothetical protein
MIAPHRYLAAAALAAILLGTSVGFASCAGVTATAIGDILKSPRDYDGKTVVVAGTVRDAANLLVIKYYVINDGTGDLTVITQRAVPNPGDKVRIRGKVDQAFAFKGRSVVVLHEASE